LTKVCYVALILLVILLLYALGKFWTWLYEVGHGEKPCFASKDDRESLLYVLEKWEQLMRKYKLVHWIDHGTLLGSVLFEDLIPWDQDADVAYLFSERYKVDTLVRKELEATGIDVKNDNRVVQLQYGGILVDVFAYGQYREIGKRLPPSKLENETLTRSYYRNSEEFEQAFQDIEHGVLFPLSTCKLGRLSLACPHLSRLLLTRRYPYSRFLPFFLPFKLQCYLQPWHLLKIIFGYRNAGF